jgi:hypothetical protein
MPFSLKELDEAERLSLFSNVINLYCGLYFIYGNFILDFTKILAKSTGVKIFLIVVSCGVMLTFAFKCLKIFIKIFKFKYKAIKKIAKKKLGKVKPDEPLAIENLENKGNQVQDREVIEKQIEEGALLIESPDENPNQPMFEKSEKASVYQAQVKEEDVNDRDPIQTQENDRVRETYSRGATFKKTYLLEPKNIDDAPVEFSEQSLERGILSNHISPRSDTIRKLCLIGSNFVEINIVSKSKL